MTDHPELVRNRWGQYDWQRQYITVPKDAVIDVQKITHDGVVMSYSKAAHNFHAFVDPPGARRARVRWMRWAKRYLKFVRWMGWQDGRH